MADSKHPREYDAVLGTGTPSPLGAVVLGGLEGVKQRLASPIATQRIAALLEAQKYGRAGLDFLIQGLQDESLQVQRATYLLLQAHPEAAARAALEAYDPYVLFECLVTLKGHAQGITAVAMSSDGRSLISASRDRQIIVWDWWAREEIFRFNAHTFVFAITIDPDGQTFAIRGKDKTVKAWSLRTGQQIRPEEGTLRNIASVTLSQDDHLISGSRNTIKIWNLKSGREVCTLQGHTSLVTSVAVNYDRHLIVSGSEDTTVRVWGVA